ncbi:DUF721 domain-containing protein [Urechidicola sp. KH5]
MARRNNEAFSIKDLMKDVLKENKLTKGMLELSVKEAWDKLMGPGVVSYTESLDLNQQTLTVRLKSSVLREELSYGKEKIIAMINEEIGQIAIKKITLL